MRPLKESQAREEQLTEAAKQREKSRGREEENGHLHHSRGLPPQH